MSHNSPAVISPQSIVKRESHNANLWFCIFKGDFKALRETWKQRAESKQLTCSFKNVHFQSFLLVCISFVLSACCLVWPVMKHLINGAGRPPPPKKKKLCEYACYGQEDQIPFTLLRGAGYVQTRSRLSVLCLPYKEERAWKRGWLRHAARRALKVNDGLDQNHGINKSSKECWMRWVTMSASAFILNRDKITDQFVSWIIVSRGD